jgi:intracellular multiplication protein IcmJ
MVLNPIALGIARPAPKAGAGKSVVPGEVNRALKKQIFARDDYTCAYCGFRAEKFQDIHHLDHNNNNIAEDNLITACTFCHQCFNLQDVHEMRSGVLIWMPEIPQIDLHHIARAIYIGRIAQGGIAEVSRKILDIIMARKDEARKRITTDDPNILAMILRDYLPYKHYQNRHKRLKGIRLFPLDRRIKNEAGLEFNQFPQILAYWRSKNGPFGGKKPQDWVEVYHDIAYRKSA